MRETSLTLMILPAAVQGDAAALDRLVVVWGPAVLRWCARLGGPAIDEEDAAHDVFERVFEGLHTLREPGAFPSWLFMTTRRVVSDHRRRARLRRWLPFAEAPEPGHTETPLREHARSALARRVQEVLDGMAPDLREVLVLCEMEERDGPEVAALLDLPLGTLKSRLRRAREQFARDAGRRHLTADLLEVDGVAEGVS